jgi:hypothetical protein
MHYRVDLEHVTDGHIEIESYNIRKTKKTAYSLAKTLSDSQLFHKLNGSENRYGEKAFARVWVQEVPDDDAECFGILTAEFKYGKKTYETIG